MLSSTKLEDKPPQPSSSTDDKHMYIRDSVISFINSHCSPNDHQDGKTTLININSLDDIVLEYVVGVLINVNHPNDVDVQEFSEIISAYFPTFELIPHSIVLQWVGDLIKGLTTATNTITSAATATNNLKDDFFHRLANSGMEDHNHQPTVAPHPLATQPYLLQHQNNHDEQLTPPPHTIAGGGERVRMSSCSSTCSTGSTTSSWTSSSGGGNSSSQQEESDYQEKLDMLLEMFPSLSVKEAGGVLSLASQNLERAAQIVLLQIEDNLSIVKSNHRQLTANIDNQINNPHDVDPSSATGGCGGGGKDVKVLKERLVKRYGFIDESQDAKEFKPLLPKEEPKKLVRYREGQVVSTKGERYSEVTVTKDGEEVKFRSYVSNKNKSH